MSPKVIKKQLQGEVEPYIFNVVMYPAGLAFRFDLPVKSVLSYTAHDAKGQAEAMWGMCTDCRDKENRGESVCSFCFDKKKLLEAYILPQSHYPLQEILNMSEKFLERDKKQRDPPELQTDIKHLVQLLKDHGYSVRKKPKKKKV